MPSVLCVDILGDEDNDPSQEAREKNQEIKGEKKRLIEFWQLNCIWKDKLVNGTGKGKKKDPYNYNTLEFINMPVSIFSLLVDKAVSFPLMTVTSSMTLPLWVLASLDWVTVYLKL